jgi:hypothetical protein
MRLSALCSDQAIGGWRIDDALGYRFTNYLQGKLQYSFSHQDSAQEGEHLVATQLTL